MRNKTPYIVIAALLFLVCCASPGPKMKPGSNQLVIEMAKTKCRGRCPEYQIRIHENGEVLYEGRANVERLGSYVAQLTNEQFKDLVGTFEASNFEQFEARYDVGRVTDIPSTHLTYQKGGLEMKVIDRRGAPEELKQLEAHVEALITSLQWTQVP